MQPSRFDAGGEDEGEEGRLVLQDLLGHPLDLGVAAHRGLAEEAGHRPLHRLHPALERAAREGPVPDSVPQAEHDGGALEQLLAELTASAAALGEAADPGSR